MILENLKNKLIHFKLIDLEICIQLICKWRNLPRSNFIILIYDKI